MQNTADAALLLEAQTAVAPLVRDVDGCEESFWRWLYHSGLPWREYALYRQQPVAFVKQLQHVPWQAHLAAIRDTKVAVWLRNRALEDEREARRRAENLRFMQTVLDQRRG